MESAFIKRRLSASKKRIDGRNVSGRITLFHRGGGSFKRYIFVDFLRVHDDLPAVVKGFFYDPNRNASIALICYQNEVFSNILALSNLKIGDIIMSSKITTKFDIGNCSRVINYPAGLFISNVESRPGSGGKFFRSCGVSGQILRHIRSGHTVIKMKTGEQRLIFWNCRATVGVPAQHSINYNFKNIRNAGHNRKFGRRPVVRGVAMNPVDHPHGGAGGRLDRSPWGWLTKGPRTSNISKRSFKFIIKKRKH